MALPEGERMAIARVSSCRNIVYSWQVASERIVGIGGSTISRTARRPEAEVRSNVSVAGRRLVIRLETLNRGDAYAIVIGS
jgi:hypothetical protein